MIIYKALSPEDVDLFGGYPHPAMPEVGYENKASWRGDLESGHYRPEWLWVALRDGEVVARMAFWSFPGDAEPKCVDWFQPGVGPDRVRIGGELMAAAYAAVHKGPGPRPEYVLRTPASWREIPEAAEEITARVAAAEAAGLSVFVERHGFKWTTADGLPERSTRLEFRPAADEDFVEAVRDSYPGTLDAYTREDVAAKGAQATAEEEVKGLADYPQGRDFWRLAYDGDGSLVGAIFPNRNYDSAIIAYIAVLPEHRGKGYVDDLLAEMLHVHVADGAESVTGHTDMPNTPMKAAFDRAGFATNSGRIDLR